MDFNLGKILEKYMAKYPCCIIKNKWKLYDKV